MLVIVKGYKINSCPWFGFCRLWWQFWDISFCRCRCPYGFGSWETIRLNDVKSTFSESGSGVAAGRAGRFLFMVGHPSAPPAQSVSLLMSLTEW